ncbi:hypothetical protein HMN09_00411300 [Mycena chlorophos]|uniref:Uncharacterized protein n=1 Tax=Mycena chlorophos TaxID=658473 RepID=A0A8H6THF5_MYCCL|nr:hypothetical protein HMN09_00411300 [Mycena chlorophos]
MDPLAAKLNDLALANADGLLNDDEYRLLRQNLFERYTTGLEIVSVSPTPVVPMRMQPARNITGLAPAPPNATVPRRKHVELADHPPPRSQTPPRSKMSGVALFLRRATGRRSPSPSPTPIKLSMPRMFSSGSSSKRHEETTTSSSSDTDTSSVPRTSSGSRKQMSPTSPIRAQFLSPPQPASPSRAAFAVAAAPPSKYDVVPGGSNDIFDDENLSTSRSVRDAIAAVEAECRRLVTAFNDLETSAVIRYRQEHPERPPASKPAVAGPSRPPMPTHASAPGSSSSSSGLHTKNRSRSNSQRADVQSIRSNTSLRTTKSTASFFTNSKSNSATPPSVASTPPSSANNLSLGSRIASLRRKGSMASLSSQPSSFLGVGRSGSGLSRSSSNSALSRSTSHLPLPPPAPPQQPQQPQTMMELLHSPSPSPEEGGEELAEVRRRRAEMIGRCEARLEYLRARLKTAELHEKLLRK